MRAFLLLIVAAATGAQADETPFPTKFPTRYPTGFPTGFPSTKYPSAFPTKFPTKFPTVFDPDAEYGSTISHALSSAGTICKDVATTSNYADKSSTVEDRKTKTECAMACFTDGYGQFIYGMDGSSKCTDGRCVCRCPVGVGVAEECAADDEEDSGQFDLYTIGSTVESCSLADTECNEECLCGTDNDVKCTTDSQCYHATLATECIAERCATALPGGTKYPTKFPTAFPSTFPSAAPDPEATAYPSTAFPTAFPSREPTAYPTEAGCCACDSRRRMEDENASLRRKLEAVEAELMELKESLKSGTPSIRGASS